MHLTLYRFKNINMKKLYIIISVLTLQAIVGCKKFIDINYNPNQATSVQEKLLIGPIEYNILNSLAAGPENINNATLVNHYMQLIVYNQTVPNFGTYNVTAANSNSSWSSAYVTELKNLSAIITISTTNNNLNYKGIAEILKAYVLVTLTDWYGDIPYTQADFSTNLTPTYDSQESIYKAAQALLDAGIADITTGTGLKPSTDDIFYSGDLTKWKKLAYTLKARYYMHLTKAPGYTAAAQANLALTTLQNGMASNADDWAYTYPGSSTTLSRIYGYNQSTTTLVASSAIVDTLVKRSDPRLSLLIALSSNGKIYNGRAIGTPNIGVYATYSLFGTFYGSANSIQEMMPYAEALFIKAEATLIASGVAASQPIYQAAVTANMTKMGITTAAQTTYLASRGSLGNTYNQALERIMQEKKIADIFSIENYNDWRRTGYPVLTVPPNALLTAVPRIFYYPQNEIDNNPQPQNKATRTLLDRVWWDVK